MLFSRSYVESLPLWGISLDSSQTNVSNGGAEVRELHGLKMRNLGFKEGKGGLMD
jgi:hypothetical protein